MSFNLRHRSFLKELDLTPQEWAHLLRLARDLKAARYAGTEVPRLRGKRVALIFEKTSTRTRCAFEVAAQDQGATTTYIGPGSSQLGHKESVADTARVLGRMYDGIEHRGFSHEVVELLARHAGVPVWNGLSDRWHPTQSLCDVMTMLEHSPKPAGEVAFAYCGDARNNVASSLLVAGAMTGMDVRMVAPRELWPETEVVGEAKRLADLTGAGVTVTDEVADGVRGVDFVHTDVWVSMGEPEEVWDERVRLLRPYQVNAELMAATRNPEARFMHCLPAFHDRHTAVGAQIFERTGLDGLEVTDDVFESPRSIVFEQSENRLHTIKAVLVATLGD